MAHLCWNFKFLNHSQLEKHANASFDEVNLCDGEVAEAKIVQILSVDVVSWGASCFLNRKSAVHTAKMGGQLVNITAVHLRF